MCSLFTTHGKPGNEARLLSHSARIALQELDLLVQFHVVPTEGVHLSLEDRDGLPLLVTFPLQLHVPLFEPLSLARDNWKEGAGTRGVA